jgi:hypothetical protein
MPSTFEWNAVPGALYVLHVGTEENGYDALAAGLLSQPSYTVSGLPVGPTLYARVWTLIEGVWYVGPTRSFTVGQ